MLGKTVHSASSHATLNLPHTVAYASPLSMASPLNECRVAKALKRHQVDSKVGSRAGSGVARVLRRRQHYRTVAVRATHMGRGEQRLYLSQLGKLVTNGALCEVARVGHQSTHITVQLEAAHLTESLCGHHRIDSCTHVEPCRTAVHVWNQVVQLGPAVQLSNHNEITLSIFLTESPCGHCIHPYMQSNLDINMWFVTLKANHFSKHPLNEQPFTGDWQFCPL